MKNPALPNPSQAEELSRMAPLGVRQTWAEKTALRSFLFDVCFFLNATILDAYYCPEFHLKMPKRWRNINRNLQKTGATSFFVSWQK